MRPRFRFSMVDISPGTIITFRGDDTITAEVFDDRHIIFDGEVMTLSRAASRIRGPFNDNGPRWWIYRGKTLDERRREMER